MDEKKSLTESELFSIGSSLCARSEHCSAEICTRLLRGTDDKMLVARVIARLCEEGFIDEERYTRAFINDKLRFARWGRLKIRQELWRKQVPESIYGPLLDAIDESQYISVLRDLIKAKRKSLKGKNDFDVKMKLLRFCTSRGFEPKYIYPLLQLDDSDFEDFSDREKVF